MNGSIPSGHVLDISEQKLIDAFRLADSKQRRTIISIIEDIVFGELSPDDLGTVKDILNTRRALEELDALR